MTDTMFTKGEYFVVSAQEFENMSNGTSGFSTVASAKKDFEDNPDNYVMSDLDDEILILKVEKILVRSGWKET